MRKTDMFTIDGLPILVPDGDLSYCEENLESSDSGFDESGVYHRFVTRHNVRSWDFSYSRLTQEEYAYMEALLSGKDTFWFRYKSTLDDTWQQVMAYRSKHSILCHCASNGQFRDYRFRITTCY